MNFLEFILKKTNISSALQNIMNTMNHKKDLGKLILTSESFLSLKFYLKNFKVGKTNLKKL